MASILGAAPSASNLDPRRSCPDAPAAVAHYTTWQTESRAPRRGVAVVAHGLNHAPAKMDTLAAALNDLGWATLRLDLRGHGDNFHGASSRLQALREVTASRWHDEALRAVSVAGLMARRDDLPLALVGFSLGGLVFSELLATTSIEVDAMVLIAPAVRPHLRVRAVRLLRRWPSFVLTSAAPEAYRANQEGTPIAAYEALFALIDRLDRGSSARLNVPTLVLIDEADELVDAAAVRTMIAERGLFRWQGVRLRKSPPAEGATFHHLMTDEDVVGPACWRAMMARIGAHLEAVSR